MKNQNHPEAYGTRSEKREHGISAWREDLLKKKVQPWQWLAIIALYIALMFAAVTSLEPIPALALLVTLSVMAWVTAYVFMKRNASITALSKLTPIIDKTTLEGQATILRRSIDLLLERLNDKEAGPTLILFAMQAVLNAARPLMERAGVTPETAEADGYPSWPEIDRTEMPTRPGDFLTVHAMRLDAIAHNVVRVSKEPVSFEETVARLVGGVVPPLRAIEAVISPEDTTPIATMQVDGAAA